MEQSGSRRRSQERTREALLRAAAEVFARRGFHAATLPEIARAAGCSTGAVYSNFKNKEDLFLALLGWFAREMRDEQRAAPEAGGSRAVRHVAARWLGQLNEHPEIMLLLVEFWLYAVRNPGVRPRLAERFGHVRSTLAEMIALTGDLPGPQARDAALAAQALAYGYALLHGVDPDGEEADPERFERVVAWLYEGVTSRSEE